MVKSKKTLFRLIAGTLVCFLYLIPAAHAGIPEPGIILYGKVNDDQGTLITGGNLVWTFTPSGGGDPVSITTPLSEIEGAGGPFSYSVLIP